MGMVLPFYSLREIAKDLPDRRYHDNSACVIGHRIPSCERREGQGGKHEHQLCDICTRLHQQGR